MSGSKLSDASYLQEKITLTGSNLSSYLKNYKKECTEGIRVINIVFRPLWQYCGYYYFSGLILLNIPKIGNCKNTLDHEIAHNLWTKHSERMKNISGFSKTEYISENKNCRTTRGGCFEQYAIESETTRPCRN